MMIHLFPVACGPPARPRAPRVRLPSAPTHSPNRSRPRSRGRCASAFGGRRARSRWARSISEPCCSFGWSISRSRNARRPAARWRGGELSEPRAEPAVSVRRATARAPPTAARAATSAGGRVGRAVAAPAARARGAPFGARAVGAPPRSSSVRAAARSGSSRSRRAPLVAQRPLARGGGAARPRAPPLPSRGITRRHEGSSSSGRPPGRSRVDAS